MGTKVPRKTRCGKRELQSQGWVWSSTSDLTFGLPGWNFLCPNEGEQHSLSQIPLRSLFLTPAPKSSPRTRSQLKGKQHSPCLAVNEQLPWLFHGSRAPIPAPASSRTTLAERGMQGATFPPTFPKRHRKQWKQGIFRGLGSSGASSAASLASPWERPRAPAGIFLRQPREACAARECCCSRESPRAGSGKTPCSARPDARMEPGCCSRSHAGNLLQSPERGSLAN